MIQKETSFASVFVLDVFGGVKQIDISRLTKYHMIKPIWIHLDLSFPESVTWLENNLSLPDYVKETLIKKEVSNSYIHFYQSYILFVACSVNMMPKAEPDDFVFLRLYANKKMLITTSLYPTIDFKEIIELFLDKNGPKNTDELMLIVLENTLDHISKVVADIENYVDVLEEDIITGCLTSKTYAQLSEFLRQILVIRRFMVPEREMVGTLQRRNISWFQLKTNKGLKDCFDRIQRIVEDIDLLEKRIWVNQDVIKNHEYIKMQRNMYMLTVMAGLFLPLSFLSGLFGMNLSGIPFNNHPYGFIIICFLTFLIGLIVLFVFKKLKWI